MVGRFTTGALLGALMLNGVANALSPMGMHQKALAEIAQERFDRGLDGVNFRQTQGELVMSAMNGTNSTITKHYFELPIDHFSDCSDTYQNAYWVQDKWYRPGGPVFIFDGGEAAAAFSKAWLVSGFFARMLKEFGGMGILWEHRYYGDSIPKPMDYTYLTTEQALADLPAFAPHFSSPRFPHIDLTPASTPWLFVGGSYPGIRAAFSRQEYPDTFHAAWAASAPVQARVDMSVYWSPVIPGMKEFGFGDCLADIQAANGKMDHLLADPSTGEPLKRKFGYHNVTNSYFAEQMTVIFTGWQSRMTDFTLEQFCFALERDQKTNTTAPPGGWAPVKGVDWVIDHMAEDTGMWGRHRTNDVLRANDLNSWTWQYCTQWGFLQGAGPELHHLLIKYDSIAYQESYCRKTFPNYDLPTWPEAGKLNKKYGGWDMRPSNVFWSGDEFDPWRTLSPLSGLPHAPDVEITREIPACGVPTSQDKIFGHVMQKTAHCFEFFDDKQAQGVQQLWSDALKQWLPCFQKKSKSDITIPTPPKCSGNQARTPSLSRVPIMNDKRALGFSA